MGIIRLSLFTIAGLGGALMWFGRDEDLPDDRLGREKSEITTLSQSAPVATPVPDPPPKPQPLPAAEPQPDPEPDPEPESAVAVAAPPPVDEPVAEQQAQVPTEPDAEVEEVVPLLYVTGSRVNLRAGPSTEDSVVTALSRGTAVDDLGSVGDGWSQIRVVTTGESGYMASRFLSPVAP